MSVTGGIMAGIGLAGSIGGAAISANAAGNAASTQANAADYAANLQKQESDAALAFQEKEFNTQQGNLQPWLKAGQGGLTQLQALLNNGPGGLLQPFQAPTLAEAENEPGYQFSLGQGEQALQNSAAAKGQLVSGNSLEALNNYAQNAAQNNYQNVYNRSFNTFESNQANTFNRLAALSGIGQTAATTLGTEGQQAAGNVANIDLTAGAQQGQDYQNAAAAEASGYVGGANAWSGALGGSTNSLMNLMLLSQLGGGGAGQYSTTGGVPPSVWLGNG